jgi:asparagine synthase (glutamine-hydrolysing)
LPPCINSTNNKINPMCGIAGIYCTSGEATITRELLARMTEPIKHRGPDESSYYQKDKIGLGFRRLSIIDPANGSQPFFSPDGNIVLVCNGEIYNYRELRDELTAKDHVFKTQCDVEVLIPLYLEYGPAFVSRLNGQFAIVLYDRNKDRLLLARDHFGICPLFYSGVGDQLLFASEIKSILTHPLIEKAVNLRGLDQVFTFPGLLSPNTMFANINSVKPGHYLIFGAERCIEHQFWDLDYPDQDFEYADRSEDYYVEALEHLLIRSVSYRMNADVPIGFYLSGGLDSSLIGALMHKIRPAEKYRSFSVGFPRLADREIDESRYQRIMADRLGTEHNEISFDWLSIEKELRQAVYFSETPLKETYNTCSLALSGAVRNSNLKVILSGEGSDELFGGYAGYKLDTARKQMAGDNELDGWFEEQLQNELWGDGSFFYEKDHHAFREITRAIYSDRVNHRYGDFNCLDRLDIDKGRLMNRHVLHKRSYLDMKLRLSDHLIADHCDRVCYANSVEGRYPFLDIDLVEFVRTMPPEMKLRGMTEKYILKKLGTRYLPESITRREKFGFVAPGSPQLLHNGIEWVNDMLSYDKIKRQGYFNPDTIENIKKLYRKDGFSLQLPYESDLLMVVLTFNIFLDVFHLPNY